MNSLTNKTIKDDPFPTQPPWEPAVLGRVSIIMAAFNADKTIGQAVESCLAQQYLDFEVIVVNDGSTDQTANILSTFGQRIRTIHQLNRGLASARNTGAAAATGEFIVLMDADDITEPSRLSLQQKVLGEHGDVVLVASNFSAFSDAHPALIPNYEMIYYQATSRLGGLKNIFPKVIQKSDALDSATAVRAGSCHQLLLHGNFVHPGTVMVRRSAFKNIGFFDTSLRYSSDYDWILRVATLGLFAFIDVSLLRYRLSSTQMSHKASAKIPLETLTILQKVASSHPELAAMHASFIAQKSAECYLNAADGAISTSRFTALVYWWHSVMMKTNIKHQIKVLAKILIPKLAANSAKKFARRIKLIQ